MPSPQNAFGPPQGPHPVGSNVQPRSPPPCGGHRLLTPKKGSFKRLACTGQVGIFHAGEELASFTHQKHLDFRKNVQLVSEMI